MQTLLLDAPKNSMKRVLVLTLPFTGEATAHREAMQPPRVTWQRRMRARRGHASKQASRGKRASAGAKEQGGLGLWGEGQEVGGSRDARPDGVGNHTEESGPNCKAAST